jgi:hypothetical protein
VTSEATWSYDWSAKNSPLDYRCSSLFPQHTKASRPAYHPPLSVTYCSADGHLASLAAFVRRAEHGDPAIVVGADVVHQHLARVERDGQPTGGPVN